MSSGVLYLTKFVVLVLSCLVSKRDQVPLDYVIQLMHSFEMLLLKPNPYEKARRIILFLGAASLVMGVAKLFGAKDNTGDKNQ